MSEWIAPVPRPRYRLRTGEGCRHPPLSDVRLDGDHVTTIEITEAQLQARILDWARLRGWMVCHIRAARTAHGWRTPYEGDSGLPDLILARAGEILMAELKSAKGKPTLDQLAWLNAAGARGHLWRPCDWDAIVETLR